MIEVVDSEEFLLQGHDPVTECVCVEWRVFIRDIAQLREILGSDCANDPDLKWDYFGISRNDMRRIGKICVPPLVPVKIYTRIGRRYKGFDDAPYLVHTNFELPLMLEGRKPLAVFGGFYPSDWVDDQLAPFDQFVQAGTIVRRIVDTPMPHLKKRRPEWDGARDVYFALPGEEWRIDAYILLMATRFEPTASWDDSEERLQGSLLGYEDWQNDWWVEQRIKRRTKITK